MASGCKEGLVNNDGGDGSKNNHAGDGNDSKNSNNKNHKDGECNNDINDQDYDSNDNDDGYGDDKTTILLSFEASEGVLCEEVVAFLELHPGKCLPSQLSS